MYFQRECKREISKKFAFYPPLPNGTKSLFRRLKQEPRAARYQAARGRGFTNGSGAASPRFPHHLLYC